MITCKPDVKTVQRRKTDQFILAGCDGIWEKYVDNSQALIDKVKQLKKEKKDLTEVITELLEDLIAVDTSSGIGCDNMTAILIAFN